MQKKLLAVLLALCLVLAFSSLALAADTHFTVDVSAGSGNTATIVNGENNKATIYSTANEVTLTFKMDEGYDIRTGGNTSAEQPNENGLVIKAISGGFTFNIGEAGVTDNEQRTYYEYSFSKVSASIDASNLYKDDAGAKKFTKSGSGFLVPAGVEKVYVKITPPADGVDYTVSGADGKPNAAGYAAVTINDTTTEFTVALKIGGETFASQKFTLLPLLKDIYFNDDATNTGRTTLPIERGVTAYNTKDHVDSDWSQVYIKPNAYEGKDVSVKWISPLSKSGDWWVQRMSRDVYELTVTVKVGDDSEDYILYLMNEDYEGPTVKSFEANEKSTGRGDEYLVVVDNQKTDSSQGTIYVFLPEGESEFYAKVTMNGSVDYLRLGSTKIEDGKWYEKAFSSSTSKLTFDDEAGIEYKYTVNVIKGNKKYDDATLKSLTVKSGSKQSTADTVDIGFDPDVTEYAFPVSDRDVWLSIAAKANESHATVFINEKQTTSVTETKLDTDAVTEYEILVVAGDGVTTETYTVTVNGSVGLLQTLSASNTNGLTPAFKPDINTYTAYANAGTSSTYIYALAKNYSSDYVQISKANFNEYGQVKSYTALTKVVKGGTNVTASLDAGSNIFRVDVLASEKATTAKDSYYVSLYVPTADPKCVVSSQKLYVNGKEQTLSAYNIAGNNYLKLRDIAALLDGTTKEMKVDWDQSKWTASMAMPGTFTKRGDELTTLTSPTKYAISTQFFTYNAAPVFPLAYNVTGSGDATGSNYVMLRDVASLLDFGVTYNAASKAININTTSEYTPGL